MRYELYGKYDILDVKDYDITKKEFYNFYKSYGSNCYYHDILEERKEFINKMTGNALDYIIELKKKFDEDKENGVIKKSSKGRISTNSLKKWLKNNDIKNVSSTVYYGRIFFLGEEFYIDYSGCLEKIIDKVYHNLIYRLSILEERYYLDNDTREQKITELKECYSELDFECEEKTEFSKFGWSSCRTISDELLEKTLPIYKEYEIEVIKLKHKYSRKLQEVLNEYENKENYGEQKNTI